MDAAEASAGPAGAPSNKDDSLLNNSRKRSAEEAKLEARREANRMHAFKSRQRSKLLLTELQRTVEQMSRDKAELERRNAVLLAQVEVLQQQNRVLMQNQQQMLMGLGIQPSNNNGQTTNTSQGTAPMPALANANNPNLQQQSAAPATVAPTAASISSPPQTNVMAEVLHSVAPPVNAPPTPTAPAPNTSGQDQNLAAQQAAAAAAAAAAAWNQSLMSGFMQQAPATAPAAPPVPSPPPLFPQALMQQTMMQAILANMGAAASQQPVFQTPFAPPAPTNPFAHLLLPPQANHATQDKNAAANGQQRS